MSVKNEKSPIHRAIEKAGGVTKFSKLMTVYNPLGVSRMTVYLWCKTDNAVPAEYCPLIEDMTGVMCEELRPDVMWSVLRENKAALNNC